MARPRETEHEGSRCRRRRPAHGRACRRGSPRPSATSFLPAASEGDERAVRAVDREDGAARGGADAGRGEGRAHARAGAADADEAEAVTGRGHERRLAAAAEQRRRPERRGADRRERVGAQAVEGVVVGDDERAAEHRERARARGVARAGELAQRLRVQPRDVAAPGWTRRARRRRAMSAARLAAGTGGSGSSGLTGVVVVAVLESSAWTWSAAPWSTWVVVGVLTVLRPDELPPPPSTR